MLARLCLIGFRYAQPFLIHRTTDFTASLEQPDEVGWGLTGAWLLVFLGLAVSPRLLDEICTSVQEPLTAVRSPMDSTTI